MGGLPAAQPSHPFPFWGSTPVPADVAAVRSLLAGRDGFDLLPMLGIEATS